MLNSENLPIVILSLLISISITYFVVQSAVKSATSDLRYYAKMLNRMKIKELKKQGMSFEEISKLFSDSDTEFWDSLKS